MQNHEQFVRDLLQSCRRQAQVQRAEADAKLSRLDAAMAALEARIAQGGLTGVIENLIDTLAEPGVASPESNPPHTPSNCDTNGEGHAQKESPGGLSQRAIDHFLRTNNEPLTVRELTGELGVTATSLNHVLYGNDRRGETFERLKGDGPMRVRLVPSVFESLQHKRLRATLPPDGPTKTANGEPTLDRLLHFFVKNQNIPATSRDIQQALSLNKGRVNAVLYGDSHREKFVRTERDGKVWFRLKSEVYKRLQARKVAQGV